MKNILFLSLFLFITVNAFSQIKFEKGYIITIEGDSINVNIKNYDWRFTPESFKYQIEGSSDIKIATPETVKEFGIKNEFKYIQANIQIDKSSDNIEDITYEKNPQFVPESVFLKVILEGKSNLYEFSSNLFVRYFYKVNSEEIQQLVHRKYKSNDSRIITNVYYKQQILNDLKCDAINYKSVENIDYTLSDLKSVFTKYNACYNVSQNNFDNSTKKSKLNFTLRPGVSLSSLRYNDGNEGSSFDYKYTESYLTPRLGFEVEYVLPSNKNKWSVFVEPTLRFYKSDFLLFNRPYHVDYNSLELPIGVRHYLFLNTKSKIFINGAYIFDFDFKGNINSFLIINSTPNFALGAGYSFSDKYNVELRYHSKRNILNKYEYYTGFFKNTSLIFGWRIF